MPHLKGAEEPHKLKEMQPSERKEGPEYAVQREAHSFAEEAVRGGSRSASEKIAPGWGGS